MAGLYFEEFVEGPTANALIDVINSIHREANEI